MQRNKEGGRQRITAEGEVQVERRAAQYMLEVLDRDGVLYQQQVVYELGERFGETCTHQNANGNLAISSKVLAEFRKLTEGKVVWEKSGFCWRWCEPGDEPGRSRS